MPLSKTFVSRLLLAALALGAAAPAAAIPAFARKYGTSCLTCHTVYPRLTPFGEAFRRNGYRFPGVDSDFVKMETVPLGQEANKKTFPNAAWPSWVPSSAPLAIGANGTVTLHPTRGSDAAQADNGAVLSLDPLVTEAHVWGGGSIDDAITFWFELTVAPGAADLERAQVLFNDVLGPPHLLNVVAGRGIPTLSSFGPHSSYVADTQFVTFPLPTIYGSGDAGWQLADNFNLLEVNGVAGGRFEYGVGLNAGSHLDAVRPTKNVYAHLGYKLGGMRLDGEGGAGSQDVARPWAETALTVHGFYAHAETQFTSTLGGTLAEAGTFLDTSDTAGVGARIQYNSLELNLEWYWDKHDQVTADAAGNPSGVTANVVWGELSYIVFPWLVPAVRVEYIGLSPAEAGARSNYLLRVLPGVAMLVRPNVRVTVVGVIESTDGGIPDKGGSWAGAGGTISHGDAQTSVTQFAGINAGLAFAF